MRAAFLRVFRALARLSLRQGVPFDTVAEVLKRAFVDVAHDEFAIPGRKQSASRIAVLTGIHRKEVGRILADDQSVDAEEADVINNAAGVIGAWRRDKRYQDKRGKPHALEFEGRGATFSDLVRRYGLGDVPARAMLDELLRVNAVERLRDGRIKLIASAYLPATASPEAVAILGTDAADLVAAIDHNLTCEPDAGFFQRKVAYDNLPEEAMDEILEKIRRDGREVIERIDRTMAKHDRDANSKVEGTGRKRAMFGVYCYAEDVPEDDES